MSKFCTNCGNELHDEAVICPKCGISQETKLQVKSSKNGIAIAGFVLSFFFGILGLVFSIIGINKSKKTNTGKGLAIVGIILSSIKILTCIIMIATIPTVLSSMNNAKAKSFERAVDYIGSIAIREYDLSEFTELNITPDITIPDAKEITVGNKKVKRIVFDDFYELIRESGFSTEYITIKEAYIDVDTDKACIKAYPTEGISKYQNDKYSKYNVYSTKGCN